MKLRIVDLSEVQEQDVMPLNQAYDLWFEVNAPTAATVGETLISDAFFRAKICMIIEDKGQVLGLSLANFLDFRLSGIQDHSYLSMMSRELRRKMSEGQKRISTVEWVTMDPKLRGSVFGAQMGHILLGLSFYVSRALGFDCSMGYSRTDLKIDKIVEIFGGHRAELTQRFNTECGVMIIPRDDIQLHPRKTTQRLIDQIWEGGAQFDSGRKVVTAA